jgi:uncharacterized protein with HEPN domain
VSRADQQRAQDVLDAAAELADIVSGGHDRFLAETVRQRAAERLLEIIGEAANALTDEFRSSVEGIPWSEVTRLRVRLAHHYHRVDREQVWTIAERDVPDLARGLEDALGAAS